MSNDAALSALAPDDRPAPPDPSVEKWLEMARSGTSSAPKHEAEPPLNAGWMPI
jgi:hypothetical protein